MQSTNGACLILEEDETTFWMIVKDCGIEIQSKEAEQPFTDFLSVEEGAFVNGIFVAERRLNGDEITTMTFDGIHLLKIKLFSYQ